MSFIQTNDRLVNLKNVSNINIVEKDKRIVFNMNYYIEIERRGEFKLISDYCYWDLVTNNQFDEALNILSNNEYYKYNFINHNNSSINIGEISSVKFSDKKNRIIFNLSHPKTFTDFNGNNNITSEFVYFDFENYTVYKDAVKEIKLTLLGE